MTRPVALRTVSAVSATCGIDRRTLSRLCAEGRVSGAVKVGWGWLIPVDRDGRPTIQAPTGLRSGRPAGWTARVVVAPAVRRPRRRAAVRVRVSPKKTPSHCSKIGV